MSLSSLISFAMLCVVTLGGVPALASHQADNGKQSYYEVNSLENDAPQEATGKNSVVDIYNRAKTSMRHEMYEEALDEIETGIKLDPTFMPFLSMKATALSKLRRYAEAAPLMEIVTAAAPGNSELQILAIENILKLHDSEEVAPDLVWHFSRLDPKSAPALLQNIAQNYTSHGKEFRLVVSALLTAGHLPAPAPEVLRAYLGGNIAQAENALKRADALHTSGGASKDPLLATLHMLVAEGLQAQKTASAASQADSMYARALALGYDAEKLYAIRAEKDLEAKNFAGAAAIYASFWRKATDPALWAAMAAKSYANAGRVDSSIAILQKALAASPNHHYLLGLLYYYLEISGDMSSATAFAKELEAKNELLALDFGKYLVAETQHNQAALAAYADRIQHHLKYVSSMHIQDAIEPIIEELPTPSARTALMQQANLMRDTGWTLWGNGRYGDAYAYWRDAAAVNPETGQASVPTWCAMLIQENMIPQALEIFRLYYPSLNPISLVMCYIVNNQWYAAQPLLMSTADDIRPLAWKNLLAALGALKNGTPQQVEATAKSLTAAAGAPATMLVTLPVNASGKTNVELNDAYYGTLLLEYMSELSRQDYTQQLSDLLHTDLLRTVAPSQAASVLSASALTQLLHGDTKLSAIMLTKALELEPAMPDAHLGMALVLKIRGNQDAAQEQLAIGMASKLPIKDYILGRFAMLDGHMDKAVNYFTRYLRKEPQDLSARYELFGLYLAMPNYVRAREQRDFFARSQHNPEAVMYLALTELELGNYTRSEKLFRKMLQQRPESRAVILGLVQSLKRQERFEEANALLAAKNLQDPEVLTVLRNKAEQAERDANPLAQRRYAEEYLRLSPDSPYLNAIYNNALRDRYRAEAERLERMRRDRIKLDKGTLDTSDISEPYLAALRAMNPNNPDTFKPDPTPLELAENHAKSILARNSMQSNALESELDIALQKEDYTKAADISRDMARDFPYDEHYKLQSTVHNAAAARYGYAFKTLEKESALGINAAGMALAFPDVAHFPRTNAYTVKDVAHYLDALQDNFRTVNMSEFMNSSAYNAGGTAAKIPLLVLVGQISPEDLVALDGELKRRNARGVLLVSEQSFMPDTPRQLPGLALLKQLQQSGRWELVLTDSMERTIVNSKGRTVSFWAERGLHNGQPESYDEMRARWRKMLQHIRGAARKAGFDIAAWQYPGGDYGQLTLDGDADIRAAYTDAVKDVFDVAFVPSENGYHTTRYDPHKLPVRNIYSPLDGLTLTRMAQRHPTRLALMTEGLVASWNGQLPRAERLFAKSENLGLSPEDLTYYRGANALYDGDTPYALQLARKSRELEPKALRSEDLLARAEKLMRPRVGYEPQWWYDSEGRSYYEHTARASTHVTEKLALSATTSDIIWGTSDKAEHGYSVGAGLRYYPLPQHWLDLSAQDVMRDKGSSFARWDAAWHGAYATDFLNFNGTYDLSYGRAPIETLESIEKEIYADQFAVNTQARVLDRISLEAQLYGVLRTDGNNTKGLSFSPKLIIWEKPNIRVGYQFNAADSDQNPDAYYAPQEYYNHMAVVDASVEIFENFSINGMYGYGTAISKDKDWENVTRYGGGFTLAIAQSLNIQGNYQHLQLPSYTLDQYSLGVQYIF